MKKLEQKILRFIQEKKLIGKKEKVLVALSGGPDSVFLLHLFLKYRKKFNIKVGAAHINHKIRGKEADNDERFCRELALKSGIDFFAASRKVSSFAQKNKLSLEEAGRISRYTILESIRKKNKYDKIATAHNCSDNAETVLINLIKGTGLKGISGIPDKRDRIIRPVLCAGKEEILEYLQKYGIGFRTDPTNSDISFDRNFIRHKIIPEVKARMNPALEETLLNSSEVFRNYWAVIERLTAGAFHEITAFKNNILHFSCSALKKLDRELRGDVFKSAVERNFSSQITFNDFMKFLSLSERQTGTSEELSGGLKALKERDKILVFRKPGILKSTCTEIKVGERIKFEGHSLSIKEWKGSYKLNKERDTEYISGDELNKVFLLRRWEAGDRFNPIGLKGSKKISDFLNEQKIPSLQKKNQLVLINKNRIVWVLGLRIDDRFKIKPETKKVLQLCLK